MSYPTYNERGMLQSLMLHAAERGDLTYFKHLHCHGFFALDAIWVENTIRACTIRALAHGHQPLLFVLYQANCDILLNGEAFYVTLRNEEFPVFHWLLDNFGVEYWDPMISDGVSITLAFLSREIKNTKDENRLEILEKAKSALIEWKEVESLKNKSKNKQ